MNIGYFADGPWSYLAFEKLIQDESINIKFIVPRTDTKDDTLKNYANKYKIDYLYPVKINSKEFIDQIKYYNCDLFVSMSFNQIFRKEILSVTPLGTINCHAGKLPFYRGRNILNWVLINGESEFGITVHFVDEGIDTGDILLQRTFQITIEDTYKTLLEVAYLECAEILYDSIKLLQANNYRRIEQKSIDPIGFYCGIRSVGDEVINWNQNSLDIYNFIRSVCAPGPKASTYINGELVMINSSRMIVNAPNYKGTVGQILSKTENGFLVKTLDNFIEIIEVESKEKLKVGLRFNNI